MKSLWLWLGLLLASPAFFTAQAQVSGIVFRDINGNGQRDSSASFREPRVAGVQVELKCRNGQTRITSTDPWGQYYFSAADVPAGTAFRLYFAGLGKGDYSGLSGSAHRGLVRFGSAPAQADACISAPDDFWNNNADPDPALLVVQHPRGTYNGYNAGRFSVVQLKNSTRDPQPPPTAWVVQVDTSKRAARFVQTGTIFGIALQRKTQRVFATASLKRTFGLGPFGPGGVYIMHPAGSTWSFAGGFSLQDVIPLNSSIPLDFGSVTRVLSPDTDNNFISGSSATTLKSRDNDAFAKVGKMAIGGIDIDPLTDSAYLINLFQRRLVVFDANISSSDLINANPSTLAPHIRAYDLASLPGFPVAVGAGNTVQPYAIRIYKGMGYIGAVSTAQATQQLADLKGYILRFDPANVAAGFTTELTIHFNNYQGPGGGRAFRAWANTWSEAGGTPGLTPKFCPQPMISDIEFEESGSMAIAIRDRWGDQNAMDFNAVPNATQSGATIQQGDVLRACKQGSSWVLEGTTGSCYQPVSGGNPRTSPFNPAGFGNSYGMTGREFYADVSGDGENESAEGAVAKLMGSDRLVLTCYDPIEEGIEPTSAYWNTQGLHWNNSLTGRKTQAARTAVSATLQVAKANGMGDIEFVTTSQPIEIGNRVWHDVNGDGLQDPDEPGLAGIAVQLRSPGIDGVFGNADDQVWTTTTDSEGHYFFGGLNTTLVDWRKPSDWHGVSGLLPNRTYRIEIDRTQMHLVGFMASPSHSVLDQTDELDSDGEPLGHVQVITFQTRTVQHRFDFGFRNLSWIGDYVWYDVDGDGWQDPFEQGVPHMLVRLWNTAGQLVDSTRTDGSGYYRFLHQRGGTQWRIEFVPPSNETFTTPSVGGQAPNNSKAGVDGFGPWFDLPIGDSVTTMDAGIRAIAQVLPVRLLAFQAMKSGTDHVLLTWKAICLPGFDRFVLERSPNARDFQVVGVVSGILHTERWWDFTDWQPVSGANYYRIKLLEQDGTYRYSETRLVTLNQTRSVYLGPNPADQFVWVRPSSPESYQIQVYDQQARLVWTSSSPIQGHTPIPTQSLADGIYILELISNRGKRESFRFLVKH